jgi:hypothetical protein
MGVEELPAECSRAHLKACCLRVETGFGWSGHDDGRWMQACLLSAEVEEKVELIQLMVTGVEYHQVLLYPTVHATGCHMQRCNTGSLSFITCTADQAECCYSIARAPAVP